MEREQLLEKYKRIEKNMKAVKDKQREAEKTEEEYGVAKKEEKSIRDNIGCLPMLIFLSGIVVGIAGLTAFVGLLSESLLGAFVFLGGGIALALLIMAGAEKVNLALNQEKNDAKADEYHREVVLPLESKLEEVRTEYTNMKNLQEMILAQDEIPEPYQSLETIAYFVQVLENRRADSEKEIYNLYEEELHRRHLEEQQQQLLEEQKKANESRMKCPKCGSISCVSMMESHTSGSDFSAGKGCCGFALLGPIGLLCGACGEGRTTTNEMYWVCQDCGKKFKQ